MDLVDNVIVVHMDKKRDQLKHFPELTEDQRDYFDSHHDMLLRIEKQRHGAFEGGFAFYNHPSLQMTSVEGKAIPFDFNDLIQTENTKVCPNYDLDELDF